MTNRPERWTTHLDESAAIAVKDWLAAAMDDLGLSTQAALIARTREKDRYVSEATIRPLLRGDVRDYRTDKLSDLCRALDWPSDTIERLAAGEHPNRPDDSTIDLDVLAELEALHERFNRLEALVSDLARDLRKRRPTAP